MIGLMALTDCWTPATDDATDVKIERRSERDTDNAIDVECVIPKLHDQ